MCASSVVWWKIWRARQVLHARTKAFVLNMQCANDLRDATTASGAQTPSFTHASKPKTADVRSIGIQVR